MLNFVDSLSKCHCSVGKTATLLFNKWPFNNSFGYIFWLCRRSLVPFSLFHDTENRTSESILIFNHIPPLAIKILEKLSFSLFIEWGTCEDVAKNLNCFREAKIYFAGIFWNKNQTSLAKTKIKISWGKKKIIIIKKIKFW